MIKKLKAFVIQMLAGANIVTVLLMLASGYSDRLDPTQHPLLSTVGMGFPALLVINVLFLFFWLTVKWRMAWIPVAGLLSAYVPISIYFPLNMPKEVPEGALKIVSYNVCTYGGNHKYEDGFGKVLDYLTGVNADIVCLQEDTDTWRRYVFDRYQKLYAYNDTAVVAKNRSSFNAVGIHTRYPILKRERIPYASVANGSVAWWLKVGSDTLIVINNHFESCHLNRNDRQQYQQILRGQLSGDSARNESRLLLVKLAEANAKRAGQVRRVHDYAMAHDRYAVIVCGDFNDNPISYSRHAMADRLTDCYAASGRGVGLSYNQKGFAFRIDHIFCNKKLQPYNCYVDAEMDASDHNALVCWLKMTPNP